VYEVCAMMQLLNSAKEPRVSAPEVCDDRMSIIAQLNQLEKKE
jgi:hypothetical protein